MVVNTRTCIVHAVDFVNMVLQAEDGIKNGKGKKVSSEEFDNLWN